MDFYTLQLYISPDVILCREGEMGRYVVPCIVSREKLENGEVEIGGLLYEEEANNDCLVYIYSLNKLFSILILFSHNKYLSFA